MHAVAPKLPTTVAEFLEHRKIKATRTINDEVETLYLKLIIHDWFRLLLEAVYDDLAVEGSLAADNYTAAWAIRDLAKKDDQSPQVAALKLATISKALQVVSRRYAFSRKERRNMVGGVIYPENNGND